MRGTKLFNVCVVCIIALKLQDTFWDCARPLRNGVVSQLNWTLVAMQIILGNKKKNLYLVFYFVFKK